MVCCGITAENTARWVHLLKNVAFFFLQGGLDGNVDSKCVCGPEVALVNE